MSIFAKYKFPKDSNPKYVDLKSAGFRAEQFTARIFKYFQENPNESIYYISDGNIMVIGYRSPANGNIIIHDTRVIRSAYLKPENN